MGMNKNTVLGWSSFVMFIIGLSVILLGLLKYINYAVGFSVIGLGFWAVSWIFHTLKGRI